MWLNLKNVTINKPCKKLDQKNAKYTVLKVISSHNYKLDTPPRIHNVFHASLLKRAAADPFPSQCQGEVERILKRRTKGRQRQVLIKWKGYLNPTWEPTAALANTEAYDVFKAGG